MADRAKLEEEANRILGEEPLERGAYMPSTFSPSIYGRPLYVPQSVREIPGYRQPKQTCSWATCVDCGRKRHSLSGQRCRACYCRLAAAGYLDKKSGLEWMSALHSDALSECGGK